MIFSLRIPINDIIHICVFNFIGLRRYSSRTGNGFPNGFTPTTASQSCNALEVENGDGIDLAKVVFLNLWLASSLRSC